ncbi:DUF4129 domain-containing transglutaminase family protein [Pseudalkalibacillus caeni]|uniref:DUF4129 domain-containing protein n=1 Tax=Exobacillus caeni TaxID=2574798 RepID=A0A5R9EYN7_9BACL|nr:transglutaminase domain-containing protein [Pseudalkalibacillus caeni]TLS35316.1 DUF4129 domain-containing protein [Pseudalkalibacillus caeni]
MQQVNRNMDWANSLLLYALGFLLFWEWLRPLTVITDTNQTEIFILFTAFLFLLSYFQMPVWISIPLKAVALLYSIHALFFPGSFFDREWLDYLISDFIRNTGFVFDANWNSLSSVYRTLLFFILLWLISYLMQYWLIQTRRIFLFLLVTIVYITVIDTFTAYSAETAIIRIVVIGFVLLGLLQILRIQEQEGVIFDNARFPIHWLVPLVLVIGFSSMIGYVAPKADPQWPDPVPFIKKTANVYEEDSGRKGNFVSKIGYGEDDSRLGGPFIMDETPVFQADIDDIHYWRVETKDIYTGKGWETSDNTSIYMEGGTQRLYDGSVETEEKQAKVMPTGEEKYPFIIHPGQTNEVIPDRENVELNENKVTGKITTKSLGEEIVLDEYTLKYDSPTFSEKELRESGQEYPDTVSGQYLQLPDSLPGRIKDLAEEITSEETNAYDKARAIENYFIGNGYVYETKDVAVPAKDEDYVDQFLFETKMGYCDNYSTSMTVMLRSIGIPARWVKGFTEGEFVEPAGEFRRYEIKNSNAHSWPEAYFPGVGWVPFEPTRSFTNRADFVRDYNMENNTDTEMPTPEKPEEKPEEDLQANSENDSSSGFSFSFTWTKWHTLALVALLVVLVYILFKNYKKLLKRFVLFRFNRRKDSDAFSDAYLRLLWLLDKHGIKKGQDQTLREYAVEVDRALGTSDMKTLTKNYERTYYRNEPSSSSWNDLRKLWENLISKLQS